MPANRGLPPENIRSYLGSGAVCARAREPVKRHGVPARAPVCGERQDVKAPSPPESVRRRGRGMVYEKYVPDVAVVKCQSTSMRPATTTGQPSRHGPSLPWTVVGTPWKLFCPETEDNRCP